MCEGECLIALKSIAADIKWTSGLMLFAVVWWVLFKE